MAAKSASQSPRYRLVEQPDELRAKWRTGNFGIAGFMLFFLCGWSLGCFLIVRVAIEQPELRNIAGASVFCIGWLFAFMVLVSQLLGRERLTLNADGLTLRQGSLWLRRTFVPLRELVGFGAAREDASVSSSGGTTKSQKIDIRSIGRPIRCGENLPIKSQNELKEKLRRRLKSLQQNAAADRVYPPLAETTVFRRRPGGGRDETELRTPNDLPIPKPSDSRTQLVEGFDRVRFVTRGRFHLGAVLGALMIAGFWCGITGVFVYNLWVDGPDQPQGLDWYTQFLFLIPFELIGLAFLLMVLLIAIDPLRAWVTSISTSEIVDGFGWLGLGGWGLGRLRRYLLGRIDRLEVRLAAYHVAQFPAKLNMATIWAPEGSPTYTLVLIESGELELCYFEGLTFGEACWMADALIRRGDLPWAA